MMKKRRVLSLLVLFACWLAHAYGERQHLDPQWQGVRTYQEFLDVMPPAEAMELVQVAGVTYLRVEGPTASLLTLPSGSSAYVFDRQGVLVDWTADIGDDGKFTERWCFGNAAERRIMPQEALHWLQHVR
jgi:hypothetical protein